MLASRFSLFLALPFCFLIGCDYIPTSQTEQDAPSGSAELERLAEEKATAVKAAADAKAAAEKAAAEAEAKAKAEAEAEVEAKAKKLGTCCQALARRGFEQRSMDDMAAKKRCLKGVEEEVELSTIHGELTELLGERKLPKSCLD